MKLGFIILAHNLPKAVRRLTELLTGEGDQVVVHFDSSASQADLTEVRAIAAANPDRVRIISKVHCVWGEWSLVEAVIQGLLEFARMPDPPDYIHLMSGADFPLRPVSQLREFLTRNPDLDFIECCDISEREWVKGGLGRERFRFYYPVNFRTSRATFDRLVRWQRKLRIRRRMPRDLQPHMGSQWWTLRWATCARFLEYHQNHPEVSKFFKSTWIPDEAYFQTIIAKLVPKREIADLQLMFHHLTPTGRPYVFYKDHLDELRKLPHFFIRKISPSAMDLVDAQCQAEGDSKPVPKINELAETRDLVRERIDGNYLATTTVPGNIELWYTPEIRASRRPFVLFVLNGSELLPRLEEIVRASSSFCWEGRPFAATCVDMPAEALERIGMSRESWKLRDFLRQQFIYHLVSSPQGGTIPAAAIVIEEDPADLQALSQLPGLLPLVVRETPLKPHQLSQLIGKLHAGSPGFNARTLYVSPSEVAGILDDLAEDTSLAGAVHLPSLKLKPQAS
jgi:hypothetical protein